MLRSGLLVVSVISIAALCAQAAEAEIRIGVAGAMTGVYAWFGEQYQRGTELAVADQKMICDDICFAPEAKPEFKSAARFFARFRSVIQQIPTAQQVIRR